MILTVHRGTRTIGGSCVELQADGRRLFIDLGLPLMHPDGSEFAVQVEGKTTRELIDAKALPDVQGLYKGGPEGGGAGGVDGLLLSHAHQDHYGLAHRIRPEIPVHASQGTRSIIEVSEIFLRSPARLPEIRQLEKVEGQQNRYRKVRIGRFTVQPYPVDHSAPEGLAFLVEAGGKRVFYSGDFRNTGRTRFRFDRLLEDPPGDVDALILEGTLMGSEGPGHGGGPGENLKTEEDVERELSRLFGGKADLAAVFCSTQNVDRLVSIFKAARKHGQVFVIDLYGAYLLDRLEAISRSLPQYSWEGMGVLYDKNQADKLVEAGEKSFLFKVKAKGGKVEPEEIEACPERYVMLGRTGWKLNLSLNRARDRSKVLAIWSMYSGYLTRDEKLLAAFEKDGIEPVHVHTSGHAQLEDLKALSAALAPRHIVPIHTLHPEVFREHFDRVRVLEDGVSWEI